jgi:hypothetical protein
MFVFCVLNIDNPVKSLKIVMPDPVSGTGQARSGIQNALKLLDSGFRRNDGKEHFSTFYEFINIKEEKIDYFHSYTSKRFHKLPHDVRLF